MPVERAGEPERRAAECKRLHLEHDDVLAGDRRHLLVLADGAQHAGERRVAQPIDQHEQHHHQRGDETEVEQVELHAARGSRRTGRGMPDRPSVPLVSQISLLAHEADRLGEAERHDGEIVASQPHRDQRDDRPDRRREAGAGDDSDCDRELSLRVSSAET